MRTWVIGGLFVLASTAGALAQDAAAGEMVFNTTCRPCHDVGPDAKPKLGPPLNGINGRKAGTAEGFTSYSDGLKNSGIVWDRAKFLQWVAGPQAVVPGTRMAFAGLKDETAAANLWAYISAFKADGSK